MAQIARLRELAVDAGVRAVVLTGSGEKAFIAGADIKYMSTLTVLEARAWGALGHECATLLETMPKATVAAVNGFALGGGCEMALGCDIRLMSDAAKLVPGFAKRGVIPESGGTWYLPRLVGWARACEIGFLGDDLDPARSLELGLVNAVVPADRLLEEAGRWAAKIADNAPLAIKAMKRLYRHGLSEDFEAHSHHVLMQLLALFRSRDFREGIAAFVEKRDPRFEGR